jgi:hypothetical protein
MNKKVKYYLPIVFLSIFLSSCFHNEGQAQGHGMTASSLTFPQNKDVVEIPFSRYKGWILIKVSVNDSRELSFILDTGAPIAILPNADIKDELNLQIIGNAMVGGADANKPRSVPLAGSVKFKIGEITIENGYMAVGAVSETIDGADGIIGKYLFDGAVVTIDWQKNKLILTRPDKFTYAGKGETFAMGLLPSGHIYTDINVEKNDRKISVRAGIDIGNKSYFQLDKGKGAALIAKEKIIPDVIVGWGANGSVSGDVARTNVAIGSFKLDDVVTTVMNFSDMLKNDGFEANMGITILEKFTITFDYPHKKLILEKNESYPEPFAYTRSGIIRKPKREGDHIVVAGIIPSSPAQESGLQKDDRIASINGKKITELSVDVVEDILKGKSIDTVEIGFIRGGKELKAKLKMRDLI